VLFRSAETAPVISAERYSAIPYSLHPGRRYSNPNSTAQSRWSHATQVVTVLGDHRLVGKTFKEPKQR
jgi:hypothetical protein